MESVVNTHSLTGLTSLQAGERLALYGPNRPIPPEPHRRFKEILKFLADPMALMLLGTSGLYFFLGDRRDGFILLAAVIPVLLVDVALEFRSKEALKKLAQAMAPLARVVRDGAEMEIATDHVVPGDLLVLREGDKVHADGVVRRCANFSLDESSLTGESVPVSKGAWEGKEPAPGGDDRSFFAGSTVLTGQAMGEVLQTGSRTRFGKIASLTAEGGGEKTTLQKKTGALVKRLAVAAALVILWVFLFTLLRGSTLASSLLSAVSLGIAVIPEEFPLVLTIFLSLGAWRLGQKGVLVKRLAGVETLGSTTVICVDKTGTLTQGRFVLESHLPLPGRFTEDQVLEASVLACELSPADPMEKAILTHAREHGIRVAEVQNRYDLVHDYDFDPVGKHMSHVWRGKGREKSWRLAAKGALEGILEHCVLAPRDREWVEKENRRLAGQGARVLAVAGREAETFTGDRQLDERELKLYGLLSFQDPLRPESARAVAQCQEAGIRVKLITGDHLLTAHAVADAAGIAHEAEGLLNGPDLENLPPGLFDQKVRMGSVFARIKPEQKHAIVDSLRRSGEVVAMTGDGINDAPALRRADIGVAMGLKGTEVARAAADIVLLGDDFNSFVSTLREGRRIFSNIQKSFSYLITFKLPSVGIALVCPLLGVPLLLLPVHLVWLELIQHPVSALVFEGEALEDNEIKRPPRDPQAALLTRGQALRAALSGILLALVVLWNYLDRLPEGPVPARSMALCVFILGSLFQIVNARAMDRPWWKVPFPRTARFWLVIGAAALSLPLLLQTPWLASLFQVSPLRPADWGKAFGWAVATAGWRAFGWPGAGQSDPGHSGRLFSGL